MRNITLMLRAITLRQMTTLSVLCGPTPAMFCHPRDCCAPPVVESIRVTSPATTLDVGSTMQLKATAFDRDGSEMPGLALGWAANDESVLTVSTTGLVRGVSAGRAIVTARAGGQSGRVELAVVAPP